MRVGTLRGLLAGGQELGYCSWEGVSRRRGGRAGEDSGFSCGESVCSEGGVQLPVCIQIGAQSRVAFAAY